MCVCVCVCVCVRVHVCVCVCAYGGFSKIAWLSLAKQCICVIVQMLKASTGQSLNNLS